MNFITMLCLALANCEQFMSLSKAEDHGVSARSDLAEIDDLNLTAPSPLQRLLSADDDDEEEEEEAEEDEENEEADESEVEEGKNAWLTPQVGVGAGVGLAVGIAGLYGYQCVFGAKPATPVTPPATPEQTLQLTVTGETEVTNFKKDFVNKYEMKSENAAEHTLEAKMTLQQFKELLASEAIATSLQNAGITIAANQANNVSVGEGGDEKSKKLAEEAKKAKLKKTSKKLAEEAKKAELKKTGLLGDLIEETTGPVQANQGNNNVGVADDVKTTAEVEEEPEGVADDVKTEPKPADTGNKANTGEPKPADTGNKANTGTEAS